MSPAVHPRRRNPWLGVALGLLLLAPVVQGAEETAADPRCFRSFTDAADARVFPWIAPALTALDAELEAVGAERQAADPSARLATWCALGSGFLRHAPAGRDLDALAVFDLGRVGREDDPAEAVLSRIEGVLDAFRTRLDTGGRSPALVPLEVRGLDDAGLLLRREQALERLRVAFAPGAKRRLALSLPHEDGVELPSLMDAGEVPLPVVPRLEYVSNLVRYRRAMPSAVRGVTVILFFTVRVQGTNGRAARWTLVPSLVRRGRAIRLQENLFLGVCPSPRALRGLASVLDPQFSLWQGRIGLAGRLAENARSHVERRTWHKALKRMHQVLDLLAPVYSVPTYRQVESTLRRWLSAPSGHWLSDVEEVADTLATLAERPDVLKLYVDAGDLEAVGSTYGEMLRRIAAGLPTWRQDLERTADEVERLVALGTEAPAEDWAAVSADAARLARETGPDSETLRRTLELLEAPLVEAGYRFLPVTEIADGRIVLAKGRSRSETVSAESLSTLRHASFTFGPAIGDGPVRGTVILRAQEGWTEQQAMSCLRCRLARCGGCIGCRLRMAGALVR